MEPTRGDQISDNFPIKGSAIIVIIDAGNIINPASIGENVWINWAKIGMAYIAPKFAVPTQKVIMVA